MKKAENRSGWRKLFFDGYNPFEVKRALKKGNVDLISEDIQFELACNIWGKVVLSHVRLTKHLRLHENQLSNAMWICFLRCLQDAYVSFVAKFAGLQPHWSSTWKCMMRKLFSTLSKSLLYVTYASVKAGKPSQPCCLTHSWGRRYSFIPFLRVFVQKGT